ncbi:MAG: CoA-binding protein [Pseudomonadota bacterium]|nr:CoA-binding protein [Pseudomonadota bacterium]
MTQSYSDEYISRILTETKTIALVGWSPNEDRPSNRVGRFLAAKGYRVIPVNPGQAGKEALGETIVAALSDIPKDWPVDMVDIFRRSDAVGPVVDEALEVLPGLKSVWMQLGVVNDDAAEAAKAGGIDVVMDRCPAIEYPRLLG